MNEVGILIVVDYEEYISDNKSINDLAWTFRLDLVRA